MSSPIIVNDLKGPDIPNNEVIVNNNVCPDTQTSVLLVADSEPPKKLINNVNYITFSKAQFLNRNLSYFADIDVKLIWLNISNIDALRWLEMQGLDKEDRVFKVVCVTSSSAGSEWITRLKETVSEAGVNVLKLKTLKKLNSINTADFLNSVRQINPLKQPQKWYAKIAKTFFSVICGGA